MKLSRSIAEALTVAGCTDGICVRSLLGERRLREQDGA